ncbi:class I adenylate-forming enzyme family protein [Micromonospora sp. NPDC048999]|uniref:class I adenylate-forming enzyme family protein n=1 Tax=Micromonospora sp. NPDC048999 TaxID=3155391 RepID=UPI0033FEDE48
MAADEDFELAHSYRGVSWRTALASSGTVVDVLRARASDDRPCLTVSSADGTGSVTASFRQVHDHSARLATWLREDHGVGPGTVLGLLPANDLPSVLAIFAGLRAGATLLFLNPNDPSDRLRAVVAHQDAELVLRSPTTAPDPLPGSVPIPDPGVLSATAGPPDPSIDPAATAMLFGTSGSTAVSKIVEQSHTAIMVNAQAARRHHRLRPGDRLLGCLPLHHVNGVHFTLLATLVAGAHAVLAQRFDPFGYPKLLAEARPRLASVAPSLLETLVRTWREPVMPAGFDYFVSAAAPLPRSTVQAVSRAFGAQVRQGFGLTETTNFATTMPAVLDDDAYRRLLLDADIPSIGVALDGNEVTVLREDTVPAEPGEVGEVCIRGHNVMTGYAGNAEATATAFRGGWFHSGDLGYLRPDAAAARPFVVLTGRLKNIAKVGGEAVSLEEMERVLRALPAVRDAACVAVAHPMLGDEVIAAVVLELGEQCDIRRSLAASFPPYALPRRIVPLPAIPRTATGKILRPQLTRQLTGENRPVP